MGLSWEGQGDPAAYKRSDYWNTQAGKDLYGNYDDYIRRMKQNSQNYLTGNNPLSSAAGAIGAKLKGLGAGVGGFSRFAGGAPMPDDPILGGYMRNIQGEQRNDIDELTSRTASAGVAAGRGGFGVAGGGYADSVLRQGGMESIARGAADRYDKAMGYGTNLYGGLSDMYKSLSGDQINALSAAGNIGLGLAGNEKGALDSRAGVYDSRRQDYGTDMAAQQQWQAGRQGRMQQEMEWEQQQRDAQYQRQQGMNQENALRRATYGAPTSGASPWAPAIANQEFLRAKGVLPYTNSRFGKTGTVSGQSTQYQNPNNRQYGGASRGY